ncbi:MAG: flagellar motor switch protein FliN/FliY [bacterium]|jgi:flagellar motor switch protein FliN/FliY
MADNELNFDEFDDVSELDWSAVEGDLNKNKEMIRAEAGQDAFGGDLAGNDAAISNDGGIDINFLLDIPLRLTVEVGKKRILIKDLLSITVGSILEIDRKIGEPLDILINDKPVAKGEVIIQNEKFGLRITEIMDDDEKINVL